MENIHTTFERLAPREKREQRLGQKGLVLWLTGLSGSGKTTIAIEVERQLLALGNLPYVLDGDNIRSGLNHNLGFSLEDRQENIRRIAEVAKLMSDAGLICICCFVSPTNNIRSQARQIIGESDFKLVFINTPLEECERRDVKGLYKKARSGEIKSFTGIDSPFEIPDCPDLDIETKGRTVESSAEEIVKSVVEWVSLT